MDIHLSPHTDRDDFRAITLENGAKIGQFSLHYTDNNQAYFTQVTIDEKRQGQGYGRKTFEAVFEELDSQGYVLVSDPESFSVGALGVWTSLERDGLATRVGEPIVDELGDVYGVQFRYEPQA